MPINEVRDIAYASGNPNKTGSPMQLVASVAPFEQGYVENSATPAVLGQVVRMYVNASNVGINTSNPNGGVEGGALAQAGSTLNEVFLPGEVGICALPAGVQGGQGVYVYQGFAYALCVTASTLAVGTLLSANASGYLTNAPGSPTPGQIVARSYGTLATTATPTLVPVYVGVS